MTRLDLPAMIRAAQQQGKAVAMWTMPDGTRLAVAVWPRKEDKCTR